MLARLRPHLLSSANFSQFQSAYRKGHSTETALLEVLDGVFTVADDKQVTVLIGLDLSAAFDTVDHRLLLDRLRLEFGVTEIPLRWLQSYLEGRSQFLSLGLRHSSSLRLSLLSLLTNTLPGPSASEVTTLRRYTNLFIIIIISIIIIMCKSTALV